MVVRRYARVECHQQLAVERRERTSVSESLEGLRRVLDLQDPLECVDPNGRGRHNGFLEELSPGVE